MAKIGWNFCEDVNTAPLSIGSGWSNPSPSAPPVALEQFQTPSRPIGIGFNIDEPASPPVPPPYVGVSDDKTNSQYLGISENVARISPSINIPSRPPLRQRGPYSKSFEDSTTAPGNSTPASVTRPSSQRSEAYDRGLNDMADLMTPYNLSEAEKRKIRERFALDK